MMNVLVTGMSGTGKSTALAELRRRGFAVVDTDSPYWSEWVPGSAGEAGEWLWREERMAGLLERRERQPLYVSGCMSNQGRFYDRFGAVVLFSAPAEVICDRIARRTTNDYGKAPGERELILSHLDEVEPLLRSTSTHEIDTRRPLSEVVATLIDIGRGLSIAR